MAQYKIDIKTLKRIKKHLRIVDTMPVDQQIKPGTKEWKKAYKIGVENAALIKLLEDNFLV